MDRLAGFVRRCVSVRLSRVVRAVAIAGFSAVGAVLAHAGPAGLSDWRWLAAAGAGALLCVVALTAALVGAASYRLRASKVGSRPVLVPAELEHAVDGPSFNVLVAAMLACQGAAHVTLLAVGVASHDGVVASPVLHALFAIAGAVLVWLVGALLDHAARLLLRAWVAALVRLLAAPVRYPSRPSDVCLRRTRGGVVCGRAPPLAA